MQAAIKEGVKLGVTLIAAFSTVAVASKGSNLIGKAFRSTKSKFARKDKTETKPTVKKTTTKPAAKKKSDAKTKTTK